MSSHEKFPDLTVEMDELTASGQEYVIPVAVDSDKLEGIQEVPVFVADGRTQADKEANRGDVVVYTMPFTDEPHRRDLKNLARGTAHLTQSLIIAPANPGIGQGAGKLTEKQIEDLKKGSFIQIGDSVMQASMEAVSRHITEDDYDLYLLGNSLGASVAAGSLAHFERSGQEMASVGFAESVSVQPKNAFRLVRLFLSEGEHIGDYHQTNPEIFRPYESQSDWMKRVAKNGLANLRYARALTRRPLITDIQEAGDEYLRSFPVLVARGGDSELSSAEDAQLLAEQLKVIDVETLERTYPGHHHPMYVSIRALQNVISDLREARGNFRR